MNRKQLFLIIGMLSLGWAASAQSTGNNPATDSLHISNHRLHRQREFSPNRSGHRGMIDYTPGQREQVAAIIKEYRQKQQDLFKQDNSTLRQYKSNLLALEKEKKARLQALLTPQQKDQLASRRDRMEENRQVMAAGRLERLRLNLKLTDDQVAQIKAIQRNLHNQAKAIRDNDNLLPQERHDQMHALMMTRNDNMKTILTPDQYTKFQQMSHHRHGGSWQGRGGYNGRTV